MAPQQEWLEKDYYKVLGVSESATQKEITREYRKLAKEFHPDANPGSEEKFKEISAAYDVLGDEKTRKEYDEYRRLGPMAGGFGAGGFGGAPGGGQYQSFRVDDINDLFGGMFNRGGGGGRSSGPRRGDDLEANLTMSFTEAVEGLETTISLTSDAPCSICSGTGASPGTMPVVCPTCHGRGTLTEDQGLFSFAQPCRTCAGSGMVIEDPCKNCRGSGVERRPRQVRVRIPAGVKDSQRIRLKGRGTPGAHGGPPGDLFVVVHVTADKRFGRKDNNLTITVPITFPEAALGAEISVPTLSKPVTLKVPAGTKSGRTFRVRGYGVKPAKGSAGDLLVTVEIVVPSKLSAAEKKAAEDFAKVSKFKPREEK